MKVKTIKGVELVAQICDISGYRKYEVQDMLEALAIVVADNAKQGYATCIRGIGTLKVKQGYCIRGRSNLTGEEYNTLTAKSLTLKIDSIMSNALNGE